LGILESYKKIFDLVKPYWPRVVLSGIISILISGLNASIAWLVKPAMDDVLIKKNVALLTFWICPLNTLGKIQAEN
jgi:ABC-type multidrug transport system fused ATPase/permease subunit